MPKKCEIRRALISVYDKTGIVEFAKTLHEEFGVEIISTGGTARTLKDAGIPVTLVEDVTGFPEMMDGRVKTLHPKIHAAILADRDNPEHMLQLAAQGIAPIDMVVVNLYPFEKTVADPSCTFEQAIEMIDIGGPCLLRAAAKNHKHVLVASDPEYYGQMLQWLRAWRDDGVEPSYIGDDRRDAAANTFAETNQYDSDVMTWLGRQVDPEQRVPWLESIVLRNWGSLRYGENPHQRGELYQSFDDSPFDLPVADGMIDDNPELSFNNFADASAALELCAELTRAAALNVWHRLPAGDSAGKTTGKMPVPHTEADAAPGQGAAPDSQGAAPDSQGVAPDSQGVAPDSQGVAPASSRWKPLDEERYTRRNLPHIQKPGKTYFVTFRLREGELPPAARDIALRACQYWHGKKMNLHAMVIMPNHVHLLMTPYFYEDETSISLGEILHSIKSYSANEINRLLGRSGALWFDENWDRVIRHEREFAETLEYIETNAERANLGKDYRWFWRSDAGFEEGGWIHRLEAGATRASASKAVCFIKHTNACGAAVEADALEAYRKAYLGDPNAAMGGILAVNFPVDADFATAVMETYQRWGKAAGAGGFFVEVWLAPSFDDDALKVIRGELEGGPQKAWGKRVRLLDVGDMAAEPNTDEMDFKRIAGGVLMQSRDLVGLNEDEWKVVTERQPTDTEMNDLRLAWLVCKHTKSNAITVCSGGMLLGNGAGQMSRVMSCRIATWLAQENGHADQLKSSVAASDAFFPFRDGPDILADAGVTALIQPGGSKRDEEVIAACNERGVAMIFTGTRHFRH